MEILPLKSTRILFEKDNNLYEYDHQRRHQTSDKTTQRWKIKFVGLVTGNKFLYYLT